MSLFEEPLRHVRSWLVRLSAASLVALLLAALVIQLAYPRVGPADAALQIKPSPERLKRGEYLTLHVAECLTCHSLHDWTRFGAPVQAGSRFAGGQPIFDQRLGFPGRFPPGNLTPYGLGRYSDGALVRVLRTGVTAEGEPLLPRMPYRLYRSMSQEDLYSLVVYLRSLPVQVHHVPKHQPDWDYAMKLRLEPAEAGPFGGGVLAECCGGL